MRPMVGFTALVASVFAVCVALPASAKTETPAKPIELDGKLPEFKIADREGAVFDFAQRAIAEKDVEAHLFAAAKKGGATKEPDLKLTFDAIKSALNDDGKLDDYGKFEFISTAIKHFGFQITEEETEPMKTLADVSAWILKRKDKPFLFVVWSPRCPTSGLLNDRIIALAQETDVRMFAVASSYKDKKKDFDSFLGAQDFNVRIFPDADQRVCDILGGKQTPHFFLVDTKGVLRYKGALDNDVRDVFDEEKKKPYLREAIAAVESGKDVTTKTTKPFG